MIILADESVNRFVVRELRNQGLHVIAVAETSPGISDRDVITLASESQAFLMTSDRDFGDLIFREGLTHPPGVMLLRIDELTNLEQAALVSATVANSNLKLEGKFSVLKARSIRVRPFLA